MVLQFAKRTIFILGTALFFAASSVAQSKPPLTCKTPDGDVVIPVKTGILGHVDPTALTEVTAHLAAVGGTSWVGMQGTGKITYGPTDPTTYDVTLSNIGGHKYRLDANTKTGAMSIRINRQRGKLQNGDGMMSVIPPDSALTGLFPFELIRLAHFPWPATSLIDHGPAVIGSTQLHRISFEFSSIGRNPVTNSPETIVIDLYFDPATHLLVKSAASTHTADARNASFLFVVNYSDYRQVGKTLVPFRYTETMEGQPYWTVQLSDVQLNPALNTTYFEF